MPLYAPAELETNPEPIVRAIGRESVDVYRFLSQRFRQTNPAEDRVFQFVFRSFYRLDSAGLRPEFKETYFRILSAAKAKGHVDIESVVDQLHEIPDLQGRSTIQFSFASKLAATVDSENPIYDAEVASALGFRAPYSYKPYDQRLREYVAFYSELKALYQSIVTSNALSNARALARSLYQCPADEVSETKLLDFMFWAAGKQSREPTL